MVISDAGRLCKREYSLVNVCACVVLRAQIENIPAIASRKMGRLGHNTVRDMRDWVIAGSGGKSV